MLLEREATNRYLNDTSGPKGMGMQGFGRTDWDGIGTLTKDVFDGTCFSFIIEWCGAAMGIDIANRLRRHLRFLQGELHRLGCWCTLRMWCYHVVGVIGEAIAADFTHDRGPTMHSVLQFLQGEHRRTFRHDKAITITIKRPIG